MNALPQKLLVKCAGAVALLVLASCAAVSMSKPLPGNTVEKKRKEFEGRWLIVDEGVCTVGFDAKNVGHFASITRNDKMQKWEREHTKFSITAIGC